LVIYGDLLVSASHNKEVAMSEIQVLTKNSSLSVPRQDKLDK